MASGTIKNWKADKGFGFIKPQVGGADLFFHVKDCQGFQPETGMAVEFTAEPGKDGKLAAKQVKVSGNPGVLLSPVQQTAPASGPGLPGPGFSVSDLLLPGMAGPLAASRIGQPKDLHPSLLLDRLPSRQHITDQEHLDCVTKARPWSEAQYQSIRQHLEQGVPAFTCTARSRIALHLSRAGGLENANCCLHPIHGFAYLPGSGLKGLAAAYAGHLWENQVRSQPAAAQEPFICEVEDLFGWAPNQIRNAEIAREADPRSARTKKRDSEQCRGAVVFHDAFAEKAPFLEVDVLTCHYPDYYMNGQPPGDWQSPRPVTFLTIAAGTKFRFRVAAASSATSPDLVEAAKRLLLGGLHWLGAGAKTAAGYGAFDWEITLPVRSREEIVADLRTSLKPGESLWVRKGPKAGQRLTLNDDGSLTRGEKQELADAVPGQPASKENDVFIIAPNPNPKSTKPIAVRLVPGLTVP